MINYIWFVLIFLGLLVSIVTGNGDAISTIIVNSTESTVKLIISLVGIMCFWCGVMKVAEKSGLTEKIAKVMKPVLKLLFKDAAKDEKALGAIVMNAACIQLVPSTILSIRAACNSQNPGIIIVPAIISTFGATVVGITCCKILQRYF